MGNITKNDKFTLKLQKWINIYDDFSEEESEIVTGELQRQLESAQPPLHSCIHQRDFKVWKIKSLYSISYTIFMNCIVENLYLKLWIYKVFMLTCVNTFQTANIVGIIKD